MRPVVDGLVKKHAGSHEIRVLNASSRDPQVGMLAQQYGIQYVPTFVFVRADGSVSTKIVGAVPVSQLEAELAKLA